MDDRTLENWIKVKEALERSGKINSHIYRHACEILRQHKPLSK